MTKMKYILIFISASVLVSCFGEEAILKSMLSSNTCTLMSGICEDQNEMPKDENIMQELEAIKQDAVMDESIINQRVCEDKTKSCNFKKEAENYKNLAQANENESNNKQKEASKYEMMSQQLNNEAEAERQKAISAEMKSQQMEQASQMHMEQAKIAEQKYNQHLDTKFEIMNKIQNFADNYQPMNNYVRVIQQPMPTMKVVQQPMPTMKVVQQPMPTMKVVQQPMPTMKVVQQPMPTMKVVKNPVRVANPVPIPTGGECMQVTTPIEQKSMQNQFGNSMLPQTKPMRFSKIQNIQGFSPNCSASQKMIYPSQVSMNPGKILSNSASSCI